MFYRFARLGVLAAFAAAVTGCCVLPPGGRGGHGGHGRGGHYQESGPRPDMGQGPGWGAPRDSERGPRR